MIKHRKTLEKWRMSQVLIGKENLEKTRKKIQQNTFTRVNELYIAN